MKRMVAISLAACVGGALLAGCGPTTGQIVNDGVAQYQLGHLEQAKATLKQALDRSPSNPDALFYMGRICHVQKFYEQAISYYQFTLDADPSYPEVQRFLAKAQRDAGLVGPGLRFIPDPTKGTPAPPEDAPEKVTSPTGP
jgi:tetratricopeptide (TPR) repeat protein